MTGSTTEGDERKICRGAKCVEAKCRPIRPLIIEGIDCEVLVGACSFTDMKRDPHTTYTSTSALRSTHQQHRLTLQTTRQLPIRD